MKTRYLIAIIIVLIIINIYLFDNYIFKKNIPIDQHIKIESIPDFTLYDLDGVSYDSQEILNNSFYILLVFFSPTDCASCLYEKRLWKRISEEGIVKIVGIARHISQRELKDWIHNSEIDFPVLYDVDSLVTEKFNVKKTPLKILFDNEGKKILVDRVRILTSKQDEFLKKLKKILKKNIKRH